MKGKLIFTIIYWFACFAIVACATQIQNAPVMVNDIEVCGDLGAYGAHCAHTLTSETRDIDAKTWATERIGQLCMNSDAFTMLQTTQEQLCTELKVCDYESQQKVMDAVQHLKAVVKSAQKAKTIYHKE